MSVFQTIALKAANLVGKKEKKIEDKPEGQLSTTDRVDDIFKAFIPWYLYKPPYGFPREVNPLQLRQLANNPYIFAVIKAIQDEVASCEFEIKLREESIEEGMVMDEEAKKQILRFFDNPNGNFESWEALTRAWVRDICVLDSGVGVKVFDKKGDFSQLFARDGGTFLLNPDIFGYIGDRSDFVTPPTQFVLTNGLHGLPEMDNGYGVKKEDLEYQSDKFKDAEYDQMYQEQAAYFQYGWTAGARPVPFGKKEIMYFKMNPRTDSIYGRSPMEVLYNTILTLVYGGEYNLDFYLNNNLPTGLLTIKGASTTQAEAHRQRLEGQFMSDDDFGNMKKKHFKVPITGSEVSWTPMQMSSKELEVIEQQKWFSKIVWASFGMTASEMGFTEDSNQATDVNQSDVSKRRAIKPFLSLLEYTINNQLMPEFGHPEFEFKYVEYDLDEDIKKHSLWETQLRMGVRTAKQIATEELGISEEEYAEAEVEKEEKDQREFDMNNPEENNGEEENKNKKTNALNGNVPASGDSKKDKKEMKHKYIKRTGGSGNYKYTYNEGQTNNKKRDDSSKTEFGKKSFNEVFNEIEKDSKVYSKIWDDLDSGKITEAEQKKKMNKLNETLGPKREKQLKQMLDSREEPDKEIRPDFDYYLSVKDINEGKNTEGHIVKMSPTEFFDYAPEKSNGTYTMRPIPLKRVKDHVNETGKLTVGYLEVKDGKVIGHEGRHTMAVARIFGVKEVSVAIIGDGHQNFGTKTEAQYKGFEQEVKALIDDEKAVPLEFDLYENIDELRDNIQAEVDNLFNINKLAEMKGFVDVKSIVQDLLSSYMEFFNDPKVKKKVDNRIQEAVNMGVEEFEKEFSINTTPSKVSTEFLEDYVFENIKDMNEKLVNDLRQVISRGIMNRSTGVQVTKQVQELFDTSKVRARAIARTETHRANNMGSNEAAKASGLDLNKKVDAHLDTRTSPICRHLDGKIIKMNDKFKYEGEEYDLAPFHVNCRTRIVYTHEETN